MSKIIKHKFSLDFEVDFELIGICSHHSDFRLAFSINEKLGISLEKKEDYLHLLKGKKEQEVLHSKYFYLDEDDEYQFFLLKNKSEGKYLVPEKPTIDFFLFIFDNHSIELEDLIEQLRDIPLVLAAYSFDPIEIDSTHNINLV